jgi:hypothetical protein
VEKDVSTNLDGGERWHNRRGRRRGEGGGEEESRGEKRR